MAKTWLLKELSSWCEKRQTEKFKKKKITIAISNTLQKKITGDICNSHLSQKLPILSLTLGKEKELRIK